jgi:hypothetical protein
MYFRADMLAQKVLEIVKLVRITLNILVLYPAKNSRYFPFLKQFLEQSRWLDQ